MAMMIADLTRMIAGERTGIGSPAVSNKVSLPQSHGVFTLRGSFSANASRGNESARIDLAAQKVQNRAAECKWEVTWGLGGDSVALRACLLS
ncbi:hypothetical protein SKAU_G00106970 [Synaphobranchus kaupii]|uniref:Uncharacterized protein n=1 Tax=Synaphobranchus kaupii TaxID=118154 RepID=A0A9Q1J7P2_SYNKA|nr:hypothetical protein SKAU_G00106970 [Synaphobranchus kaupii]